MVGGGEGQASYLYSGQNPLTERKKVICHSLNFNLIKTIIENAHSEAYIVLVKAHSGQD